MTRSMSWSLAFSTNAIDDQCRREYEALSTAWCNYVKTRLRSCIEGRIINFIVLGHLSDMCQDEVTFMNRVGSFLIHGFNFLPLKKPMPIMYPTTNMCWGNYFTCILIHYMCTNLPHITLQQNPVISIPFCFLFCI